MTSLFDTRPDEPALLPCPFCGSEVTAEVAGTGGWFVGCASDACEIMPETGSMYPGLRRPLKREEAIARWNHRAASSCAVSSGEPDDAMRVAAAKVLYRVAEWSPDLQRVAFDEGATSTDLADALRELRIACNVERDDSGYPFVRLAARGSLSERAPEAPRHAPTCPAVIRGVPCNCGLSVPNAPVSVGASDGWTLEQYQDALHAAGVEHFHLLDQLEQARAEIERLRASHSSEGREAPSDPVSKPIRERRLAELLASSDDHGWSNDGTFSATLTPGAAREIADIVSDLIDNPSAVPSESGETPDALAKILERRDKFVAACKLGRMALQAGYASMNPTFRTGGSVELMVLADLLSELPATSGDTGAGT